MHQLSFYLGITLADDPEIISAVKKTVELPVPPFNGLFVETDSITLEVNMMGYSVKQKSFYSMVENDSVEHPDDLPEKLNGWKNSGFEECSIEELLSKTQYL